MSINCIILGAGNLATNLGLEFLKNKIQVLQVYSRTTESAKTLAQKLNSDFITEPQKIAQNADLYVIALKDSAIGQVLPQVNFNNKLILHCSGSLQLSALEKYSDNIGVLYPLQTFSKVRKIDFQNISVFIEANSEKNLKIIHSLATKLSANVLIADSDKRKVLHVAAVFVCNFVNHLYTLSEKFLDKNEIDFEVLKPLIKETTEKVMITPPLEAQTGPAVRFDEMIIKKHLEVLSDNEELTDLYKTISKSIFNHHKKNTNG